MLKYFAEKMWVTFAVQKLLTFFQQNISEYCILYIESAKTVNEMTLNDVVKLTTLWTTGPWNWEAKEKRKKRQKDCLWKQRTHYGLENGSLGFIETLHKQ